jgi:hypothetical protein
MHYCYAGCIFPNCSQTLSAYVYGFVYMVRIKRKKESCWGVKNYCFFKMHSSADSGRFLPVHKEK